MEQIEIVQILKAELAKKKERNPAFSLRGFAKKLGMSPAQLSQLLNGKRNFSARTVAQVAQALSLTPEQEQKLFAETFSQRRSFKNEEIQKRQLREDEFALIADWYHMAILSLAKIKNAKNDPVWISKRLGITMNQAKLALERLTRLNIIAATEDLRQLGENLNITSEIPSKVIQSFHRQILDKAQDKLIDSDLQKRDYSALTFLADPDRIPLVRKKIEKFQDELSEQLAGPNAREVYVISTQLFSLEENK
ncbi:MAG: TIGR02147 family protein [Bdellovibrionia bacterium]